MAEVLPTDPQAAYERLADIALTRGITAVGYVQGTVIAAVPDVVLVEYAAQGQQPPLTFRIQRQDGREVAFFVLPTVDVAVSR